MQNEQIPHSISLSEAIALTTRYRQDIPADMPLCETFDKDSVRKMLQAEGAVSMRIYYGRKESGEICAVLVAADQDGHDILPNEHLVHLDDDEGEYILEDSFRCPEACPPESPLNTD